MKKAAPARAPLRSMKVTVSFRDFVLDQLADVRDLRARAMFGGVGLYAGDVFFGILAADVLYLKVDDTTRREYQAAGSTPFRPYAGREKTMAYYGVPIAVLEDAIVLGEWAARAVRVARNAGATKRPKTRTGVKTARQSR
jgi:DNA transformation protein